MEPEKAVKKKKIKNKNWGVVVDDQQFKQTQSIKTYNVVKMESRYQNISSMSQKYTFNIQAVMGSGFASTVYLGTKNNSQQMVCIKAVDLMAYGYQTKHIQLIHKQIQFLQKFNSEYIVKLLDVYQSKTFIYLVMELCPGGDLYKMIKMSPANLPVNFVTSIMLQVAHGLQQIHDQQIVHRDMKTENIFIIKFPQSPNEKMRVKIGDLGFCITVEEMQKTKQEGKDLQDLGSPIYMSPEISLQKKYSFSSDVYAFGIIWYELFHKKAPWEALTQAELLNKKLSLKAQVWREDINENIKQMILKCISNEVETRPSCWELVNFLAGQQANQNSQDMNKS